MTKTNDLREFISTASCNNCFTILASKFNLLHLVIFFLSLNWQLFSDSLSLGFNDRAWRVFHEIILYTTYIPLNTAVAIPAYFAIFLYGWPFSLSFIFFLIFSTSSFVCVEPVCRRFLISEFSLKYRNHKWSEKNLVNKNKYKDVFKTLSSIYDEAFLWK